MTECDLLVVNADLVTMSGGAGRGEIRDGALAVTGTGIAWVGARKELPPALRARTELDAQRIGVAIVAGQLAAVIGLDAVTGKGERIARTGLAGGDRPVDFCRRDTQSAGVDIAAVEFPGELNDGGVAAGHHLGDDAAHHLFHIRGGFPLGGEKDAETRCEIVGAAVETDGHGEPSKRRGSVGRHV